MELGNKNLENFLKKAEEDPELMEILKGIVYYCQAASEKGIPLEEVASAGTVGWTIGQDPRLKEMLKHLIKISEMGLGTEH
tara:strand:- start:6415 stop:6657 length:243 start_codon:yes stop_codon:yes gene_type:complete